MVTFNRTALNSDFGLKDVARLSFFQRTVICINVLFGIIFIATFNSSIQPNRVGELKGNREELFVGVDSRFTSFDAHKAILEEIVSLHGGYIPTRHETWLPEVVGSFWWINETCPESFSIAKLDETYPAEYFATGGHPSGEVQSETYTNYVLTYGKLFMPDRRPVSSLVEFGNGGGYFAKKFSDKLPNDSFMTVEGTGAGIAETLVHWKLPQHQVVQHDLRLPLYLGRRFDVAVCTEVVEHVEPPFASQIVMTLVLHADVIWFSFKPLGLVNRAWINHPNERPLKMWKNLFDFYGYDLILISDKVKENVSYRGDLIAFRRGNTTLSPVTYEDLQAASFPEHRDAA